MRDNLFLIAEAGTGTGKSFAYLLPAMLTSLNGEQIFISTRTKNLQEQLISKDLPFLLNYFPRDLKVFMLKGRANYLCLLKLYNLAIGSGLVAPEEIPRTLPLLTFAEYSKTGEFNEIVNEAGAGIEFYSRRFSSSDGFCTAQRCPFFKKCFLFQARKDAQKSSVVIINHHLFFADLSAETELFNNFATGVFDEAHQLDSVAREYMGMEFSTFSINNSLDLIFGNDESSGILESIESQISKTVLAQRGNEKYLSVINNLKNTRKSVSRAMRNFFEGVSINASKIEKNYRRNQKATSIKVRFRYGDSFQSYINNTAGPLLDEAENLYKELSKFSENVSNRFDAEDVSMESLDLLRLQSGLIEESCNNLREIALAEESDWVYWFEMGRGRFRAGLFRAVPLNSGKHLRDHVLSRLDSAVFTSATLRGEQSFDNIKFKLGLDLIDSERVIEKSYPSPFNYRSLMRVYVPGYIPHPDNQEFAFMVAEMLGEFALNLRKNMMILTTSYAQLDSFYNLMEPILSKVGYSVYAQGVHGSAENVARLFNQSSPALLIGTDSFWEGVDFPGEKLEVLFIARLPFAVPSEPVVQAMNEYIQTLGRDPFFSFSLPEAVLKFRQGTGRLIRSSTDRGVVVILDNRIYTKSYGKSFLRSLPVKPVLIESVDIFNSILHR
ncbi:MAG: hypothetical protein GF307_01320 [candidate division Zixibacteria bacterium]|nr:hypothetical protein [candidate division Zixibacteria bacterium]